MSSEPSKPGAAEAPASPPKRRLPVLKTEAQVEAEAEDDRPAWHWAAIGTVAVFLAWLPLLYVAHALLGAMLPSEPSSAPPRLQAALIGADLLAFAIAGFAAGFLVGRVGKLATKREAMVSGISAAVLAWLVGVVGLTERPLAWALVLVVLVLVGGGSARFGGARGVKARDKAMGPPR